MPICTFRLPSGQGLAADRHVLQHAAEQHSAHPDAQLQRGPAHDHGRELLGRVLRPRHVPVLDAEGTEGRLLLLAAAGGHRWPRELLDIARHRQDSDRCAPTHPTRTPLSGPI